MVVPVWKAHAPARSVPFLQGVAGGGGRERMRCKLYRSSAPAGPHGDNGTLYRKHIAAVDVATQISA